MAQKSLIYQSSDLPICQSILINQSPNLPIGQSVLIYQSTNHPIVQSNTKNQDKIKYKNNLLTGF